MSETERVVILGAGGHAKVCIEIFRDMGIPLAYCIGGEGSPEKCLDVSVVIGDTQIHRLYAQGYRKFFVAIGSNVVRQKLADMALGLGFELVNAISPKAVISLRGQRTIPIGRLAERYILLLSARWPEKFQWGREVFWGLVARSFLKST